MSEEVARKYGRWLEADREGRDDDADAACRALFSDAVPPPSVPLQFAADTWAKIQAASERDARRARRTRRMLVGAGVTAGPVAAYFGAGALLSFASTLLVGALDFLVQASVRIATVSDWNLWSLVGSVGRAFAAVISDPDVTIVMVAMHGLAVAALIALQRLLGPEH